MHSFDAALPYGDEAAGHFRGDLDAVLVGYPYDTSLIKLVDDQLALHKVFFVRSAGELSLYRAVAPWPVP